MRFPARSRREPRSVSASVKPRTKGGREGEREEGKRSEDEEHEAGETEGGGETR